jgi:hypothetical protein
VADELSKLAENEEAAPQQAGLAAALKASEAARTQATRVAVRDIAHMAVKKVAKTRADAMNTKIKTSVDADATAITTTHMAEQRDVAARVQLEAMAFARHARRHVAIERMRISEEGQGSSGGEVGGANAGDHQGSEGQAN